MALLTPAPIVSKLPTKTQSPSISMELLDSLHRASHAIPPVVVVVESVDHLAPGNTARQYLQSKDLKRGRES